MTLHMAAYRFTVYAASRNDAAATVLTPIGGSVHANDFKVTTLPALAGYLPYLLDVEGQHGAIDPLEKSVSTGQMTVRLMDKRIDGGTNLQRWVTAYMGDAEGVNTLLGCKGYLEESLDGGTTWSAFFVGRIEDISLDRANVVRLVLRDFSDELREPVFVGRAHASATHVVEPLLIPLGLSASYGGVPAAAAMTGSVSTELFNGFRRVALSAADVARVDNLITGGLASLTRTMPDPRYPTRLGFVSVAQNIRLRFSCASPAISNKEVEVMAVLPVVKTGGLYFQIAAVTEIAVREVDASDIYYQAFDTSTVPNGTALTGLTIRSVALPRAPARVGAFGWPWQQGPSAILAGSGDPLSGAAPMYIGTINPATLFRELLDGYYCTLNLNGSISKAFAYASASFAALTSPGTNTNALPQSNWRLDRSYTLRDFVQQHICQPYHLAYRMKPNATGPTCELQLVDMRLPNAAALGSVPTITDADVDTSVGLEWSHARADAKTAVVVRTYLEDTVSTSELQALPASVPSVVSSLLKQYVIEQIPSSGIGRIELGTRFLDIDALGIRDVVGNASADAIDATPWLIAQAATVAEQYRAMFGTGPLYLGFTCRRTANTTTLWPGDWAVVDVDLMIDPATRVRGGARLVQIMERSEKGPRIAFRAIDAGPNASAGSPTVGSAPATGTPATNTATLSITVNAASDPVLVQVNVTDTGTGSVAHNAPGWVYGDRLTASGTAVVRNLPSGRRIWFRARSEPAQTRRTKALPSAWVTPATTAYVDLTALGVPTGVGVLPSPILTTSTITASWTNTEDGLTVQAILTTGGVDTVIRKLPAGSTTLVLNSYVLSSTTYTFSVRYIDTLQGVGAKGTSSSFTTPGAFVGPTLSAPTLTLV